MIIKPHVVWFAVAIAVQFIAAPLAAEQSPEPLTHTRLITLDGPRNLRDIGGYTTIGGRTVKWGKIYRSDHLAALSEADKALLRDFNITTVIDFRSETEREMASTSWSGARAPKFLHLPIGGTAADWSVSLPQFFRTGNFYRDDIHNTFLDAYRTIPSDASNEFRTLFEHILANEGAVLFHCTAGKDRTGIAAALILSVLGVPRRTIFEDFMLTNNAVDAEASSQRMAQVFGARQNREISTETMFPLVGVYPEYLDVMFASIEEDFGSVDGYLSRALKLSSEDFTVLKNLLLSDLAY